MMTQSSSTFDAIVPDTVRVLVVDDHEMVGAALTAALALEPSIEVVGIAADGAHATGLARRHQPDVVVTDFQLRDEQATDFFDDFRAAADGCAILVLTGWPTERSMLLALDAGATGFLSKDQPMEALADGVRRVAAGEMVVAPSLVSVLARRSTATRTDRLQLSRRELEILDQLSGGADTATVAAALGISPHTVRNHVARLMVRLGTHSRLEAVSEAVRRGIIAPPAPR